MSKAFSGSFVVDKKIGKGEDAIPLTLQKDEYYYTGVFDGMGGSGSTLHVADDCEYTGAYLASRCVKDAVNEYLDKEISSEERDDLPIDKLKKKIIENLGEKLVRHPQKNKSSLRSSLIRIFPTTIALCSCKLDKDNKKCDIQSIWAGDSRNYILNSSGLYQISIDDLTKDLDPMQNLREDSPLSNYVCLEQDFKLNCKKVQVEAPCCIISATDGCFGYYPSPMHFERMLFEMIKDSKNIEEWTKKIKAEIEKVTGDDFSFSIWMVGADSFCSFKKKTDKDNALSNRRKSIKTFCERESNCKNKRISLEKEKREHEIKEKELCDELGKIEEDLNKQWEKDKERYMGKIK